jgi:N-acetylneuraminic acid mutarotase
MPEPVAAGNCFTYNNDIYLFGGRTEDGKYSNKLWKYDPSTNEWELLSVSPLQPRVSASACIVGDCAYIGLGFAGHLHKDSSYLRDLWQYNFLTTEWKRLDDFPANNTVKNCFFATEDHIYSLYGFYRQFTQDVYRYDIAQNKWEKMSIETSQGIPRAMDVVGASCQGRCFLGTGFNHGSLRFWAEWDPDLCELIPRKKILGAGRNAASCCASEEYVYIAGGRYYGDNQGSGFLYNNIQRYTPETNEWNYVGNMPYEAENLVSIAINGEIYIGLGETIDGHIANKWYKFEE